MRKTQRLSSHHLGAPMGRHTARIQRDLQHAATLMAEEIERLLDIVERVLMRDEGRQVDMLQGELLGSSHPRSDI
jgi:hypothetical protein